VDEEFVEVDVNGLSPTLIESMQPDLAKAVDGLRPSFSAHVRWGERGAPVLFPWNLFGTTKG
jgi:hypothetical protein